MSEDPVHTCNKNHKSITFTGSCCPLCFTMGVINSTRRRLEHNISDLKEEIYHLDVILEQLK